MGNTIFIIVICLIFIAFFFPRAMLNVIELVNALAECFKDAFKLVVDDWRELWGLFANKRE